MEVKLEIVVRNKLIDKQSFGTGDAITNKRHQMPVVNSADDLNLCLKLPLSLTTPNFQLLHSNFFPTRQHTFVHVTEPALS